MINPDKDEVTRDEALEKITRPASGIALPASLILLCGATVFALCYYASGFSLLGSLVGFFLGCLAACAFLVCVVTYDDPDFDDPLDERYHHHDDNHY
jgi:hypothetical protein